MVKKLIMLLFFFSALVLAQETDKKQNGLDNENFVEKAASGGLMEVELGKLAQEKGNSQEVKDFGKRMERDHSKASDELKNISQKNNIQVPVEMIEKHKEHVDELKELSGVEFDKSYMKLMVEDHEEDIELFEDAAENHENHEIRSFADKTLKTLRDHHDLAKSIYDRIENKDIEQGQSEE